MVSKYNLQVNKEKKFNDNYEQFICSVSKELDKALGIPLGLIKYKNSFSESQAKMTTLSMEDKQCK